MANQLVDEYERLALRNATEANLAVVYAVLAMTASLSELVQLAREGREAWDASVEGGGSGQR